MRQREARDRNVRKIEFMIRHEKEIAAAVEEARLCVRGHTGGTPSGHSYVSDPTAAQAIRKAEELPFVEIDKLGRVEWPERWLKVVAAVREWCGRDTIRAEVFKRRYVPKFRSEMRLASSTYYFMLGRIFDHSLQCAAQAQVIKIF